MFGIEPWMWKGAAVITLLVLVDLGLFLLVRHTQGRDQ